MEREAETFSKKAILRALTFYKNVLALILKQVSKYQSFLVGHPPPIALKHFLNETFYYINLISNTM